MKKLNKLFAILVAMAMVLSLGVVSAFAEVAPTNSSGAIATKKLTVPQNATIPTGAKVDIVVTPVSHDGVAISNPTAIPHEIKLDGTYVAKDTEDNKDIYYFATDNLVPGNYTAGGVYTYNVTESGYDMKTTDSATVVNHTTAGGGTYTMNVYVDPEGNVTKVTVYDGETKKNITTSTSEEDVKANGVKFENTWTQELKGTTPENAKFTVKKTVEANSEGLADKTTPFSMKVYVDLPAGETATYKVKRASTEDAEALVPANGIIEVSLADKDELYFTNIPAGAIVYALEDDNRANPENASATYVKSGELLEANKVTLTSAAATDTHVTINNTRKDVQDTGILMSNLPYIVLALVAIGGMVAYVVVRRRNADEA